MPRYKINNFELLKQMLAALQDDFTLPWSAYPCLEWPRSRSSKGYANVKVGVKCYRVTRMAYTLSIGPIPDGESVLHHCDNPPCFRPIHLFAGSILANMQDCISKGRFREPLRTVWGSAHHMAKLTEDQVNEIRRLYDEGVKQCDIAKQFVGIQRSTIGKIVYRQTWTHIPGDPPEPYVRPNGSRHVHARLTEQQVLDIRAFRQNGLTYPQLADRFGISASHASKIVNRQKWSHL